MYRLAQAIAWLLTTVFYRLKRYGGENIPKEGPAILICNHIHMMDVACIIRQTPRKMRIMAKKELFRNPVIGWFCQKFGAFPISRGEADVSGIRTAMQALHDGDLLCIFPEGTRNRKREAPLLPLQEGVAMLALRCKADIIPSWVEGGYTPWNRCRILTGKKMDLSAFAGIRKPTQEQMQQLTAAIGDALLGCRDELARR